MTARLLWASGKTLAISEVAMEAAAALTSVFPMRIVARRSFVRATIFLARAARFDPVLSRYSRE